MALADTFTRTEGSAPSRAGGVHGYGELPAIEGEGMSALISWVEEIAALTQPDRIHWVDGSRAENDFLRKPFLASAMVRSVSPVIRRSSARRNSRHRPAARS